MRVLFIVQGEGRGHLTQAITLEQMLRQNGHEVVEVMVGKSKARRIPEFFKRKIHAPITTFNSPNFLPTSRNMRSNLPRSIIYNIGRAPVYLRSVLFILSRIRETHPDIVVNFYELLTGLTYLLARPQVPTVSIGHQYLFLHPDFELPKGSPISLLLLRLFTRITCIGAKYKLALSFRKMPDDTQNAIMVVPPLIRQEVRQLKPHVGDYIQGYVLNAGFGVKVRDWHRCHPDVPMVFFWDKKDVDVEYRVDDTLMFHQIDDTSFLHYLSGCRAYATTAGFESVCEGLYLHKPIMLVPAHIEQECNAFDACKSGAGIVSDNFDMSKLLDFIANYQPDPAFHQWVETSGIRIVSLIESAANMQLEHHFSLAGLIKRLPDRIVTHI